MIKSCTNCRYFDISRVVEQCNLCCGQSMWELKTIPNADRHVHEIQRKMYDLVQYGVKFQTVPTIKDVIFNPPATIIIWEDKTKTVVKCGENDIYDPEKGMAMAISRKALGDRGSYYNVFEKWLEKCDIDLVPAKSKIVMTPTTIEITGEAMINSDVLAKLTDTGSDTYSIAIKPPTDICEDEKVIDKCCATCKYGDGSLDEELCDSCTIPLSGAFDNYWTPKESDD